MTPSSNTGSKGTLVTWSVVATILFASATVWAIISFVNARKDRALLTSMQDRYKKVIEERDLQSPLVSALETVRNEDDRFRGLSLLNVATKQRDELAKLVAGGDGASETAARAAAAEAVKAALAVAGPQAVPTDNLVALTRGLSDRLASANAEIAKLRADLAAANAAGANALNNARTLAEQKQAELDEAQARLAALLADSSSDRSKQESAYSQLQGTLVQSREQAIAALNERAAEIAALQRELAAIKNENARLINRLQSVRGPTDQIVRNPDARIARVLGSDRVLIDIGSGDGIPVGMTFEVFSKFGVPRVTQADDDFALRGKASIEVIRVSPGSAECRVIRVDRGEALAEGDPVVNLVYDKNVPFKFFVYGKFDLDRSGDPSERDTEIVKRLISRWGGQITNEINADTDFVVVGVEPVIPEFSQEELLDDPLRAFQQQQALDALDQFNSVRQKAIELNIPLVNQNRFLFLVGYYDEAAR